jgi:phage protein D
MQHNVARFTLAIGGVDYADELTGRAGQAGKKTNRLISLQLTEKLEDGADELEITLSNHDGQLAPIKRGVMATLSLGWSSGADVTVGLVDKGTFRIDQVEKSGPPDQVRITGRSADLTGAMRRRKDKGWTGKTIGEVVKQIAAAHGLTARVHGDLAGIAVPSAEQAAKSDMAFVRDLGRRYDAVATVKNGSLLFMPIGTDTNAGNERLATMSLSRRENAHFTFTIADREENDGAEATWHDRGEARKRTVKAGDAKNPKRIKRSFASEGEAKAAARAEASRAARGQHTLSFDMPLGDAAIEPNRKVKVTGFDSEIDGIRWLIKQVNHSLSGASGFTTTLEMESLR